jgi:hypothetical protein
MGRGTLGAEPHIAARQGDSGMSAALSVAEILDKLAKRMAWHREKAAFHAQQEVHHREQSAFHAAELEKVTRHFKAFEATAVAAADLAQEGTPQPAAEEEDVREFVGKRILVSKLIARAVERLGKDETFGATRVAAETNRRFQATLRRPVDARTASVVLRRLHATGRLRLVREGKASREALYVRPGAGT